WTTCSIPAAPSGRPWTRSWTGAGPPPSSWRCWWTGATGNCPSGPTTWGRTCPRRAGSGWRFGSRKWTAGTRWSFWRRARADAAAVPGRGAAVPGAAPAGGQLPQPLRVGRHEDGAVAFVDHEAGTGALGLVHPPALGVVHRHVLPVPGGAVVSGRHGGVLQGGRRHPVAGPAAGRPGDDVGSRLVLDVEPPVGGCRRAEGQVVVLPVAAAHQDGPAVPGHQPQRPGPLLAGSAAVPPSRSCFPAARAR